MGWNSMLNAVFKSKIFTVSFAAIWVIFQNPVVTIIISKWWNCVTLTKPSSFTCEAIVLWTKSFHSLVENLSVNLHAKFEAFTAITQKLVSFLVHRYKNYVPNITDIIYTPINHKCKLFKITCINTNHSYSSYTGTACSYTCNPQSCSAPA